MRRIKTALEGKRAKEEQPSAEEQVPLAQLPLPGTSVELENFKSSATGNVCRNFEPEVEEPSISPAGVEGGVEKDKQDMPVNSGTDACGTIDFDDCRQRSRAKYKKVGSDTDAKDILRLLFDEWKLEPPKLVISVAAGAMQLPLEPILEHFIQKGLIKLAETTRVWFLTGGTNEAVNMLTGKMLHSGHRVVYIGIVPWGIIPRRQKLSGTEVVVQYHVKRSTYSNNDFLNGNHTHFLLVDDGTAEKYGGEIEFRMRLEKEIMTHGKGVPAVRLIVKGGINTIKIVNKGVCDEPLMPIVIVKHSGRAADLLASAYDSLHANGHEIDKRSEVLANVTDVYPGLSKRKCENLSQIILDIVRKEKLVKIFRKERSTSLDEVILNAILESPYTQDLSKEYKLKLAITCNRADIARRELLYWDSPSMRKLIKEEMVDVLCDGKIDFVELCRDEWMSLDNFLTRDILERLYNARAAKGDKMMKYLFTEEKCQKKEITLDDVDKVLGELLGNSMEDRYKEIDERVKDRQPEPGSWGFDHELFKVQQRKVMRDSGPDSSGVDGAFNPTSPMGGQCPLYSCDRDSDLLDPKSQGAYNLRDPKVGPPQPMSVQLFKTH